jgi:hypothetical protein
MGRTGAALIGLVAFYFFAVAGYALAHAEAYASDIPRILRYVIGPLAISVGLVVIAMVTKPDTRLALGVSAMTLLTALFGVEAVLTKRSFAGIQGLFGYLENSSDAEEFRAALPPSYTIKALNDELGVTDPADALLGGVPDVDVLLCSRDGEPVSYRADRFGFRNPEDLYAAPIHALLLGDSFAEGICLPDGVDVASRLRDLIPQTFNTGTRGTGPLFQLALLRRWGPELQPPETLFLFFEGNDWTNLERELSLPYLRAFLDGAVSPGQTRPDPETLGAAAPIISRWWEEYQARNVDPGRAWVRNFLALQQTSAVLGLHYPRGFPELPEYERLLVVARSIVAEWGGRLSVVYIPQVDRFIGLFPNAHAFDGLRTLVRDATEAADVGFIDLTVPFAATPAPLSLYAADSHFSEAGALLSASVIVGSLRTRGAD